MNIEAMKQWLEALEVAQDNLRPHGDNCFLHDKGEYNRCFCGKDSLSDFLQEQVESLRQAIEQAEKQEPVALAEYDAGSLNDYGGGNVGWWWDYIRYELGRAHDHYQEQVTDLYTHPQPQRKWVGLTGFEQKELMAMSAREAVFATEAKLKEKNA